MNRPGRALVWVALSLFAAPAVPESRAQPPDSPASADRSAPLDPQFFDLLRRTLEEIRDDLRAAESDIPPDSLRGRLLVEAYRLINNVSNAGLPRDRLLELPEALRADALRLVAELLGEPPTRTAPDDPEPTAADERPVPVRIRPYIEIIEDHLRSKFEELTRSGAPDAADRLERGALEVVAAAVCPSNDPRDLSADERDYAVRLARRIAREGGLRGADDDRSALQDDIDALLELLKRKNADLKIKEGVQGIDDRADRLERYGLDRLEAATRARDPDGEVPPSARDQVRSMAELIARGVPFSAPPEGPVPIVTTPGGPGRPPGGPIAVDPSILSAVLGLARAVDRGLIAAGVDLPTRREALRRFVREQIARKSGTDPASLPSEVVAEADRLIEQILAEGPDPTAPPPQVVRPPVVAIPPLTVPTVTPPTTILVPRPRHPWLPHRW